jgi:hypothetical protein
MILVLLMVERNIRKRRLNGRTEVMDLWNCQGRGVIRFREGGELERGEDRVGGEEDAIAMEMPLPMPMGQLQLQTNKVLGMMHRKRELIWNWSACVEVLLKYIHM